MALSVRIGPSFFVSCLVLCLNASFYALNHAFMPCFMPRQGIAIVTSEAVGYLCDR